MQGDGRGFTLVETMVAIGILGIAMFGSFAMLVHSYSIIRRTDENLYVARLMESALEMTRNLSYTELTAQPSSIEFETDYPVYSLYGKAVNPAATADAEQGMILAGGTGKVEIDEINADLQRVTVSVTWTPFRLGEQTRSATTYISRQGINKR